MKDILAIKEPAPGSRLPLVFDSPHSGRIYPRDFTYACPFDELMRAEDNHVDELLETVPDLGGTLLLALFPRTYIDVNRAENDIDTELLSGAWPETTSAKGRSHAGIGLIRRLVRPGIPVYDRRLAPAEVSSRIARYYHPYHAALKDLLEKAHYDFGQVWHLNCHSMPSNTWRRMPPGLMAGQPDFVLGDRDGTSCDPAFLRAVEDFLKNTGYRVSINDPYKGVEILRRYGNPERGFHSLQLEINKGLYWDEAKNRKSRSFNALKADIERLIDFCADYVRHNISTALAAD